MSRSYKKSTAFKPDNGIDHKKIRGAVRDALKQYDPEMDELELPEPEQYDMKKIPFDDGKSQGPKWHRGADKREIE